MKLIEIHGEIELAEKRFRQLMVELTKFAPAPFNKRDAFRWESTVKKMTGHSGTSHSGTSFADPPFIVVTRSGGNHKTWVKVVAVLDPIKSSALHDWGWAKMHEQPTKVVKRALGFDDDAPGISRLNFEKWHSTDKGFFEVSFTYTLT